MPCVTATSDFCRSTIESSTTINTNLNPGALNVGVNVSGGSLAFSTTQNLPSLAISSGQVSLLPHGGRIGREYGLGRKRTDLYIEWPVSEEQGFLGEVQRIVLELKLWKKGSLDAVLAEGQITTDADAATVLTRYEPCRRARSAALAVAA